MSPFYYRVITLLITSHNADEKRPRSRLYDSDADPAPAPAARRRRDELRKLELRISELQGAFDTERGRAIHLEAMLDARTKVTAELQSVLVNLKQFELERNLKHLAGPPAGVNLDAHIQRFWAISIADLGRALLSACPLQSEGARVGLPIVLNLLEGGTLCLFVHHQIASSGGRFSIYTISSWLYLYQNSISAEAAKLSAGD